MKHFTGKIWLGCAVFFVFNVTVVLFLLSYSETVTTRDPLLYILCFEVVIFLAALTIAHRYLVRNELRFRSLIDKGNEIIAMLDEKGKILYVSPSIEARLGYKAVQRTGRSGFEHVHPDDLPELRGKINSLLALPGASVGAQWRQLHADGSWRWMEGVATNLLHEPSVRAVVHNFRDITDAKNAAESLREKNAELQKLTAYQHQVREEERKKIAREVHDELGQLASALKIDIDWLRIKDPPLEEAATKRVTHAHKVVEILIASIRKIATSLRPSMLDDFGLNAALQWHCNEFETLHDIHCVFDTTIVDKTLPIELKVELFRIAQELMTNVRLHANARSLSVKVGMWENDIVVDIEDDGKGFDADGNKNMLGLVGLRERAAALGGGLRITSSPGKGTKASVQVPKIKM